MTRETPAPLPLQTLAPSKVRREAHAPLGLANTPRPARRTRRTAMAALTGGGVLACLALVMAMTARQAVQAPVFASDVAVKTQPATRMALAAVPAERDRFARLPFRVASPPAPLPVRRPLTAVSHAATKRPSMAPAVGHRLDAPDVAQATHFVPTAAMPVPVAGGTPGIVPAAEADHRMIASLSSTGAGFARRARAEPTIERDTASLAPASPAAAAVPEAITAEPAAPRTALAALERQLALSGVPMPTARPFQDTVRTANREAAPAPSQRNRAPSGLLAYARPDAGSLGDEPPVLASPIPVAPRLNAGTAIYDIAAATVYLPSGERLEAHSGLGSMRDDARYVRERNRGPTPPHTYDLTLRESLFHGVQAIRLNPVGGERNIHNRVGLLAHTYMLGPRGDSNGCVSVKDYKRFLAAFRRGEIRRLVVVSSMNKSPTSRLASLFRSRG